MNIDRESRLDLVIIKYVEGEIPRELRHGDVLFNNTNSPELIGKTTAVTIDTRLAYSNHMTRIRLEDGLSPTFVAHQLHFLWMSGYFRHRCVNHVNQASISAEPLSNTVPILVGPSDEQSRIAETIDELFSDLDAGVAALERVREKLKLYRASVLKAAVEGALTAEWRAQHPRTEPATELLKRILAERRRRWEEGQLAKFKAKGQEPPKDWKAKYKEPVAADAASAPPGPETWWWATIDQLLATPIVNGLSVRGSAQPPGIPALRLSAMSEKDFDYADKRYLPLKPEDVDDLWIKAGDFFVSRGNGSKHLVGRGTLARHPSEGVIFPDTMMRLRLIADHMSPQFVSTIWRSGVVRRQIEKAVKTTAGIWKIAQPQLAAISIPLPPANEQDAIVEAVEDHFSAIDYLESELDTKLKSAQGLRHAILRHAFSGQLVQQNPNDEPASELLNRIAAEREVRERQATKTKKPKKTKAGTS